MADRFISPSPPPEGYDRELLTILVEECSELITELAAVQQRASKALRFGVNEVQPGQPLTNADRLADEMGDASCLFLMLQERGIVSRIRVGLAIETKRAKLAKYMQSEIAR